MKKKNKGAIVGPIIGGIATIIAALIGNYYGQYQQDELVKTKIESNVDGNNNVVTINDVAELVDEYNNLLSENETLKEKNTSYFNDLSDTKNELESLESQVSSTPNLSFKTLALTVDGVDFPIDTNNSMVIIDGREYFSREITEKLIPDNKSITIKNDTIFIGKVVSNQVKLSSQWVVDKSFCTTDFTGKDSYGNSRSNSLLFNYNDSSIVFNLNRKYSYFKCTVSIHEDYHMVSHVQLTINPDEGDSYSIQLNKTTEPFEIELPINNCSLLTISCDSSSPSSHVIISDAILYN